MPWWVAAQGAVRLRRERLHAGFDLAGHGRREHPENTGAAAFEVLGEMIGCLLPLGEELRGVAGDGAGRVQAGRIAYSSR